MACMHVHCLDNKRSYIRTFVCISCITLMKVILVEMSVVYLIKLIFMRTNLECFLFRRPLEIFRLENYPFHFCNAIRV